MSLACDILSIHQSQLLVPDTNEEGMVIGSKQDGRRIVNVDVEQQDKQFYPLDDNREYDVIINSMMIDEAFYVAQFYMFKSIKDKHNTGLTEKDVLMKLFCSTCYYLSSS